MAISKKIRFEIFKRDDFKCQYCGRATPEVILEIDHVIPIAGGGDNNPINLITSCFDCNRGKRDSLLDSKKALGNINEQIERLKTIHDQLHVYYQLKANKDKGLQAVLNYWYSNVSSYLSDRQQSLVKYYLNKFPVSKIIEAIEISNSRKLRGQQGRWIEVFNYAIGILKNWGNNGSLS